jgi:hypothetical protein
MRKKCVGCGVVKDESQFFTKILEYDDGDGNTKQFLHFRSYCKACHQDITEKKAKMPMLSRGDLATERNIQKYFLKLEEREDELRDN